MYASSFENVNHIQKEENVNVIIYENELYKLDNENEHFYNIDLTNDYLQNKLVEHKNMFIDTLAKARFAVYYDRTYSYRKYMSPLLYITALTNTIVLFDEQSDYKQNIVDRIYKDNKDLIEFVTVTETTCKEKKLAILSDESLAKRLINIQKDFYETVKTAKLS